MPCASTSPNFLCTHVYDLFINLPTYKFTGLSENFFVTSYVGGVNTDTVENYCYYSATYLSDAVHTGQVESEGIRLAV